MFCKTHSLHIITLLFSFMLLSSPVQPATPPEATTEAVVFADERYDVVGWAGEPVQTIEFFTLRGFAPLNADELAVWMDEKIHTDTAYGTVALLPTGIVPGPILDPGGWEAVKRGWSDKSHFGESRLRRYLEAGGRLVWMGDITFYYIQGAAGPVRIGNLSSQLADLETRGEIFYGPPSQERVLTDEGRRWGLTQPWFGMPVNSESATLTLVEAPSDSASLIFLKTLNPQYPLSGLLSFPIKLRDDEFRPELAADIYKAAMFWGTPVEVPDVTPPVVTLPDIELRIAPGLDSLRTAYYPGETITAQISTINRHETFAGQITISLSDDIGTWFSETKELNFNPGETPTALVRIPTKSLKPESYRLTAALAVPGEEQHIKTLDITLVRPPDKPFFVGMWGRVPGNEYRRNAYLAELKGYGLNPVCGPEFADDIMRHGLTFVQRIEGYAGHPNAMDAEKHPEMVRLDKDGEAIRNPWRPALQKVSLARPEVIVAWSEGQAEQVRRLAREPGMFPVILNCDDFSAFYGEDFGPYSTRLFKDRTGLEPPSPGENGEQLPAPPKGVVPDDDLRLLWRLHTVKEIAGFINRHFIDAKNAILPAVPMGPVPGGMMIPLWTEGQYPPYNFGAKGFDLLSYYYYNSYWQPGIGNLYYDEIARLGNRNLPLWTTPDVYTAGDEPSYYRNSFFLHMAGGVSGLNYYAYSEHKPAAIREVGRLVARLDDLGPLQVKLTPARKRVGLFLPLACNAVNWSYPITALYAFSNLLAADIDAEPVAGEELRAGRAFLYDAIITWNADWISQSDHDALVHYIQRGGTVLLDASSEIEIEGARRLPVDLAMGTHEPEINNLDAIIAKPGQKDYHIPENVAAVREALADYIAYDTANPDVVTRAFDGGDAVFVWCVNIHTNEEYTYLVERMPHYKRTEDRPVAEEEGRRFLAERGVYDQRVVTPVTFSHEGEPAVYDLWQGKRLTVAKATGDRYTVEASMERLGGTLLGIYPSAIARLTLSGFPAEVKQGGFTACEARIYGENDRLMRGLVPCRLRVIDPAGKEVRRTSLVVHDGRLVFKHEAARNDIPGTWTVELTELASGLSVTLAIDVKQ